MFVTSRNITETEHLTCKWKIKRIYTLELMTYWFHTYCCNEKASDKAAVTLHIYCISVSSNTVTGLISFRSITDLSRVARLELGRVTIYGGEPHEVHNRSNQWQQKNGSLFKTNPEKILWFTCKTGNLNLQLEGLFSSILFYVSRCLLIP